MLTTIKGVFDHGTVILSEPPPVRERGDVLVTFLNGGDAGMGRQRGAPGALKGLVTLPEDFNEPLEDLREYM
jgi:hypothetical protein